MTRDINPALSEATVASLRQIGANIRRARKEAFKESREDFARRIGCSPMTLDRIERGDPGVAVVYLVSALHVMMVAHEVVDATSPDVLIAAMVPAIFPASFVPTAPAALSGTGGSA